MKMIKLALLLSVLAGVIWMTVDSNLMGAKPDQIELAKHNLALKNLADKQNNDPEFARRALPSAFDRESEIFKRLDYPDDIALEDIWPDEYGCASSLNDDNCAYDFLNAESYQEALWMKNNGYPTLSMIELINDPDMQDELKAMAEVHHPAAMAIITLQAMERGNFKEASMLALTNLAYADESRVYAHNLYGEALLSNKMKITAVKRFFVAGLLGDHKAQKRAADLSPNLPFASSALKGAHYYLQKVFGNSIPHDPRPKADGQG